MESLFFTFVAVLVSAASRTVHRALSILLLFWIVALLKGGVNV